MSASRVQMRIKVKLRRRRGWLSCLRKLAQYAWGPQSGTDCSSYLPPPRQDGDTIHAVFPRDRRLPGEPPDDYIARITQSNR